MTADEKEGYKFEYRFARLQEFAYLVSVHGKVEVQTPQGVQENLMHIEMEIRQKVDEFRDDVARITMTVVSAKVYNGSEAAPLPEEGQKSLLTMDTAGNVEFKTGSPSQQGGQFTQLVFPRRKIALGNFWFQETGQQQNALLAKARTKFTLSGFEKIGRKNCAIFDSELILGPGDTNPADAQASTTGRIFFCQETGQIVRTIADSRFSFLLPTGESGQDLVPTVTSLHTEMRLLSE